MSQAQSLPSGSGWLSLESLMDNLATAVPNILTSIVILVGGWLLAALFRYLIRRMFRTAGRRISRGVTRAAWVETVENQRAAKAAASGVYWIVLLSTIMVAVTTLDVPVITRWLDPLLRYVPTVAFAVAIVFVGVFGGRLAANLIRRTATGLSPQQGQSLARLTQFTVLTAALLMAASEIGLDVSLLTKLILLTLGAVLAGGSLAFGLGARGIVADILAMHYVRKAYRVSQSVRLGNDRGKIIRMTPTTVFLETNDGELGIAGSDFASSRCTLLAEGADHAA